MFAQFLQVAAGGAIGAMMRHGVNMGLMRAFGSGFPLGTMTVNIVGSFVMGAFVVLAAQRGLTHLAPFIMIGLLGGFTTFSSFSLDTMTLWQRGDAGLAAFYLLASVVLSVAALLLGMTVLRWVTA